MSTKAKPAQEARVEQEAIPPYNFADTEKAAQKHWQDNEVFKVVEDASRDKFYCLAMFPYPSGKLHMGHVRNYTITDAISRYQRMLGKNVLHPIGWDAFGLPAENAAIKNRMAPSRWTYDNIGQMKAQLQAMGFGFDWSREITTCSPEYYKWEQWFFTRLYERGLVYRRNSRVNWCPQCNTVLANEQVTDGKCWRCHSQVADRRIPQWFIRITKYAEELLSGLDQLEHWPTQVRTMQRNWIGKSTGMSLRFPLTQPVGDITHIKVFTTRPDTIMGATYLAVAPEHPLCVTHAKSHRGLAGFLSSCRRQARSERTAGQEKRGLNTRLEAIHPVSGEKIPIWAANYVLMEYGWGAVMSVPAHDQRDWEFARHYHIPVKPVIASINHDYSKGAWCERDLLINSGPLNGMNFEQAFKSLADTLEKSNMGKVQTKYRLRDWGVSRQRYWGAPIPMARLQGNDAGDYDIPVPMARLPVLLPENMQMEQVRSPLKDADEWRYIVLDHKRVELETDTFDTFMESSWYYARYCCPEYDQGMLDPQRTKYWLPVDQYVGGIEHAILHLLYARFYHRLLRDEGLVPGDEPFQRLLCQGMVLAPSYYADNDKGERRWYNPDDVRIDASGPLCKDTGKALQPGGYTKMSKSKNNGVDPEALVEKYGADSVRLFMMFAAPPTQRLEWSNEGVVGAHRFLARLWGYVHRHLQDGDRDNGEPSDSERELLRQTHKTIAVVSDDYSRRQSFNTAVARLMELGNSISAHGAAEGYGGKAVREALRNMLLLLSPVAPHICHALWQQLGEDELENQSWPRADDAVLQRSHQDLVVQINGKRRALIRLATDASPEDIEQAATSHPQAVKYLQGKAPDKVIQVPGKLINLVIKNAGSGQQ